MAKKRRPMVFKSSGDGGEKKAEPRFICDGEGGVKDCEKNNKFNASLRRAEENPMQRHLQSYWNTIEPKQNLKHGETGAKLGWLVIAVGIICWNVSNRLVVEAASVFLIIIGLSLVIVGSRLYLRGAP